MRKAVARTEGILVTATIILAAVAGFGWFGQTPSVSVSTTTVTKTVGTSTATTLQNVRIGWLPYNDMVPYFLALQMGIFQKYGLNPVPVKSAGSGPAIEALQSDQMDVALISPAAIISFTGQTGIYLKYLTSGKMLGQMDGRRADPQAVVVRTGEVVKSASDFLNKTIVTSPLGSSNQINLIYMLKQAGIDTSKLIWKEVATPSQEVALQSGQADIATCIEPFCTRIVQDKVGYPVDYALWGSSNWVAALGNPVLVSAYWTTQQKYQSNPGLYAKFVQAMQEADVYAYAFPNVAINATVKYTGNTLASVNASAFTTEFFHPFGINDTAIVTMLQAYVSEYTFIGSFKSNVVAAKFVSG